ncbi:hypothetical protein [Sporosarcina ureilytica]|uniref:Uncharacterized protein n=1 Tax=Sporosarcina ureilytica TaxID=298596 RepID=A0A1D8JGT4_9BACL|nr:hypothetical protein [Sporosarcina ureilytica]AOV07903.1 hypothetical protein BI350_10385 [Sporosarcina ureilytica]
MTSKVFLFAHTNNIINDFETNKQINFDEILSPTTPTELQFPVEGYGDTKITRANSEKIDNIIEYDCEHDFKQNKVGKVFNHFFEYYFVPSSFKSYYIKNDNLFIINTSTDPAIDFINKLNTQNGSNILTQNVNFEKLLKKLENVNGIWISDIKTQNLSASGLFGDQVDQSTEFDRIKEKGKISYITFTIENMYHRSLSVGVTQNSAIIISNKLDKPGDGIEVAKKIFDTLLKDIVKFENR